MSTGLPTFLFTSSQELLVPHSTNCKGDSCPGQHHRLTPVLTGHHRHSWKVSEAAGAQLPAAPAQRLLCGNTQNYLET